MGDSRAAKLITFSYGKLTTDVTIKLWTGIFMRAIFPARRLIFKHPSVCRAYGIFAEKMVQKKPL